MTEYAGDFRDVVCPVCSADVGASCRYVNPFPPASARAFAAMRRAPHGARRMLALAAFVQSEIHKTKGGV